MRVIIDLDTDDTGRPAGNARAEGSTEQAFADWLELLRILEVCIDDAHRNRQLDLRDAADSTTNRRSPAGQEKR